MSEATQTQTLEQTLNKTDFGHLIYEYRKPFIALLVAVLVTSLAWIFWKDAQKKSALETSVQVFEFQSKTWADAQSGKIQPAELVSTFKNLSKEVQTAPVMIPVALEMGKFLFEKNSLEDAESILSVVAEGNQHPVSAFFLGMQRAVILEKLGKNNEAIAVLEKLAEVKDVLMPARVQVELGRLYLAAGEKGKAQTQFDQVVSTNPNGEEAKLAKLYLAQLAQ